MQRHNVVLPKGDGGADVYPMKKWLRDHPEHLPADTQVNHLTSHQVRGLLIKRGWTMRESPDEISLIPPGADASSVANIISNATSDDSEEEVGDELTFALESQLRDFIASNLASINVTGKKLKIYSDNSGRKGIEYPTGDGPIDILDVDDQDGFYVFELKRADSPDRAMGQLARYMGWLKHTHGMERSVNGIIVAKAVDDRLLYAALAVPNVYLYEYEVSFRLTKVSK
jgi:hypothetical protein